RAVRGASRVTRAERDRVRARLVERPVASGRKALPGTEPATAEAPRDEAGEAAGFGALLARHGLAIDARHFAPAGRWVTPPMMPVRFDARFYLVELPEGEEAVVGRGELADGEWIRPADALARWDAGTALLHPPAWHTLRCLDLPEARADVRAALPTLQTPARAPWKLPIENFVVQQLEFQRGLLTVPLLTPTLPPATHTNCLLLGDDELWVVDPGSPYEDEQAVLERQLDRLPAGGGQPGAVLLPPLHPPHRPG